MAAKLQTQTRWRKKRTTKFPHYRHDPIGNPMPKPKRKQNQTNSKSREKIKTYNLKCVFLCVVMSAHHQVQTIVSPWFHIYYENKNRSKIQRISYRYGLKSYFVLLLSLFLYITRYIFAVASITQHSAHAMRMYVFDHFVGILSFFIFLRIALVAGQQKKTTPQKRS